MGRQVCLTVPANDPKQTIKQTGTIKLMEV